MPPTAQDYENAQNARERSEAYEYAKNAKGPAGITDKFIGDENRDFTAKQIEDEMNNYAKENSFEKRFDVRYVFGGALLGALLGTLLGAMQVWRKNKSDDPNLQSDVMMGLIYGTIGGAIGVGGYLCFQIQLHKDGDFKKQLEKKREALRRKEEEAIERHNEVVYYDAGREQSWLYRICCCPHFGKITSERVIYSRNKPKTCDWYCWEKPNCWPNSCWCFGTWWVSHFGNWLPTFATITDFFCSCWTKEVESMDYDLVMDVSVEQQCQSFCSNTGTVIIHCAANADVSIIKDMNVQLVRALNDASKPEIDLDTREEKLKYAIESAMQIPMLKDQVARASKEVARIRSERIEKAKEPNAKPFREIFVAQDRQNNPSRVNVLDVYKPYSVMDDLSYRISSRIDLSARTKKLQEDAGAGSAMMNLGMDAENQV
jgi:hypothetical protein